MKRRKTKGKCSHGGHRPGAGRPITTGRTTKTRSFTSGPEEELVLAKLKEECGSYDAAIRACVRGFCGLK